MKGFAPLYVKYGSIAAILIVLAAVGALAYRLGGESPWRWPLGAVILAGFGTIAGIFWIRRYVDRLTKASEQGDQQ